MQIDLENLLREHSVDDEDNAQEPDRTEYDLVVFSQPNGQKDVKVIVSVLGVFRSHGSQWTTPVVELQNNALQNDQADGNPNPNTELVKNSRIHNVADDKHEKRPDQRMNKSNQE